MGIKRQDLYDIKPGSKVHVDYIDSDWKDWYPNMDPLAGRILTVIEKESDILTVDCTSVGLDYGRVNLRHRCLTLIRENVKRKFQPGDKVKCVSAPPDDWCGTGTQEAMEPYHIFVGEIAIIEDFYKSNHSIDKSKPYRVAIKNPPRLGMVWLPECFCLLEEEVEEKFVYKRGSLLNWRP